jgi:transposase-like protein
MPVRSVPARTFTLEQKREHVLAYVSTPWGSKADYLREHQLSSSAMYLWRMAMADGDLAAGLVPRQTGAMTTDDVAEIRRLRAELDAAKQKLADTETDLERMRAAADALGKAIDAMQQRGVGSPKDESD